MKSDVKSGVKKSTLAALAVGAVAGIGAIVAAPIVLTGIGFTSAGIAAGSIASCMMSR